MRILLVHNAYQQFGGEDTTFLNEKALLEAAGHQVATLTFDNSAADTAAGKLGLLWRSIHNPASADRVRHAIAAHRPEVMHVHNFFYTASPAVFGAAKAMGVPTVATVQNYRLICAGAYLMREGKVCELCVQKTFPVYGVIHQCHRGSALASAQLTLNTGLHKLRGTFQREVDRFVVVTDFNRQKLLASSLRLAPGQVVVKPNSVEDLGMAPPEGRTGPYLFVGRLSAEKGIRTLLAAAAQAGFPLEILGGGPLQGEVEAAAAAHGNITYLGFQPRAVILEKMRTAQALLFPSVWYEGLPLVICEALSTGLPVIISNLGNLNEIITDGQDGLWFTPGSADALAHAVARFTNLDRGPLYEAARQTYLRRYTAAQNLASLEALYQSLQLQVKA